MGVVIGLGLFLALDIAATAVAMRHIRKNPVLRDRVDAAFGLLIRRPVAVQSPAESDEDAKNCPFCE